MRLEDERPADERVRRADQAHDLDLLGASTARRIVLTMMNNTMIPTMIRTTVPAVRRMLVTVRTRSTRSSMLITLRMFGSARRASPTARTLAGSTSLTSRLA
jgi:hypothetical protein